MTKLAGRVVVVSGAGSGIGRELVLQLLARGARVAMIDRNEAAVRETAAIAAAGEAASVHVADIGDRVATAALPDAIVLCHGAVDVLINNAGIIQPFVPFGALDPAAADRVIAVNLTGTIDMTRAFLPYLLGRPAAHVANVSSMGGVLPFPGQSVYGAAKAGVRLLTEALHAELAGTPVRVSLIVPGAIGTRIAVNSGVAPARDDPVAVKGRVLDPARAAAIVLNGIEAGRLYIHVGRDAALLSLLHRLAPRRSIETIAGRMRRVQRRPLAAGSA